MFGLSKKKNSGGMSPTGPRIPTDRIVSLSSQGLSEPEIIKTLREEGYSPLEVDRGMKQALRSGAGVQRAAPMPPPGQVGPGPPPAPPVSEPQMPPQPAPPIPPIDAPQPNMAPPQPDPFGAPAAQPAQPGAPPGFPPPQGQDRFAPTVWDTEDDMDMDMKKVPKHKQLGPGPMMDDLDDDFPAAPKEKEPLSFPEAPLPKDRGDRTRELHDRRRREVEELTEQISDEKWQDMMGRIQSIEDRIEKVSSDVQSGATHSAGPGASPQELDSIRKEITFNKQGLEETNARIDSLEEVMKGSLTPVIDSVKKFSNAVKSGNANAAVDPHPQPSAIHEPIKIEREPEAEKTEVVPPKAPPEEGNPQ